MVSIAPPSWFKALSDLGREMASQPNRMVGERFPVVVLSVPTGQFATWAISNGALSSIPKIVQPQSFPRLHSEDFHQVEEFHLMHLSIF